MPFCHQNLWPTKVDLNRPQVSDLSGGFIMILCMSDLVEYEALRNITVPYQLYCDR